MKKIAILLFSLALLFSAKPTYAVQFKNGTDVTFTKGQKIDETLFVSGTNVNFDGVLNGDLYCAGQNISITGSIKGDVICAGQSIKITGTVDGNVRVAGQSIDIDGTVTKNVSTLSQKLSLNSKSNVKGDIFFGGQMVDLSGIAGRDVAGASQNIVINGSLTRNAVVTASTMQVTDTAKLGGSLDYFVDQAEPASQISINSKSVKGEVRKHEIIAPEKPKVEAVQQKIKAATPGMMVLGKIMGIISYTLLALILLYFNRQHTEKVIDNIKQRPVVSGLIGLVVLCVAPIALLILCITVVGLPIALVLLLVHIATLFVSSLYATLLIGNLIIQKVGQNKVSSPYLAAFVGCLVVGLISLLPVLGWIFMFALVLIGLGASFLSYLPSK